MVRKESRVIVVLVLMRLVFFFFVFCLVGEAKRSEMRDARNGVGGLALLFRIFGEIERPWRDFIVSLMW